MTAYFLEKAMTLDANDPLMRFREQFVLPSKHVYFCSNSLGLPAKNSFIYMENQMKKWAEEGAHGWFSGEDAWYHSLHPIMHYHLSMILGAASNEVVAMNSLTINFHLLLTSFFRPTHKRFKILIGEPIFPSDLYAIKSHIQLHGLNPKETLIKIKPRDNESTLRLEDIEKIIIEQGQEIALIFLSKVNYLTGQVLDIKYLTQIAHEEGCMMGLDVAHAIGNVPLTLHDDQIDFAVGCSYKYLCGGPGGPGIAFVHALHHEENLSRLSGWWGNDPITRFQMDKLTEFIPYGGAASWQVSTPSILNMQPLLASLALFIEAGMANIRNKSLLQTDFLLELLAETNDIHEVITPLSVKERGNQISIKMNHPANEIIDSLNNRGFICDFRSPNVLRVAISPLYNSFQDIYHFVVKGMQKKREVFL